MPRKDKIYNAFKKCILNTANLMYPQIRKRKYSLKYYLDNFILMLNDLVKWESLKHTHNYNSKKDYHWKTIYNEHNKWSNDNIFEIAYFKFMEQNYFKLSKIRKNKKINLFIDVTKIANKYGSENIGINNEYKKKNVTALTGICDDNKLPIAITYMDVNKNKTKKGNNTIKHDINGVQKTLNAIPFTLKNYVKVNLIGDKGYVTKNKFKVFNKKVGMTYPKKKNQKKKNTKREKILLKGRHKIENFFASIKNYNRITLRRDKKIVNYMSFVYLGLMTYMSRRLNNELK